VFGDSKAYDALIALVFLFGLGAVIVSGVGLYTILTGGTVDEPQVDVLGAYACEEFEGDPEVGHEATYDIEREVLGGTEFASFDATETATGLRINATTEGRLLSASARRADGTNVSVQVVQDENRVLVDHEGSEPFRLWVDSIGAESTITRTRLAVCP